MKPEFFRHEGLQDLEAANPGSYVMLTFAGLWGHCDKNGVFEWKPRQLKLDILPFLQFDLTATLALLMGAGFIRKYAMNGREYGVIDSFADHQRVTGKEWSEPARYPAENGQGEIEQQQGNTGATTENTGREGKGKDNAPVPVASPVKRVKARSQLPDDFSLDDDMRSAAVKKFADCDPDETFRQFCAHHRSKGSVMANWKQAWTTWLCNAERFGYPKRRIGSSVPAGVVMR